MVSVTHPDLSAIPEPSIRAVLQAWVDGHEAQSADGVAACYLPDACIVDLSPPLVRRGVEVPAAAAWLAGWGGQVHLSFRDLDCSIAETLAVVSGLKHTRTRMPSGEDTRWWSRVTLILRRGHNGWRIAQERDSVPFYVDGSARAALDLLPDQDVQK